MRRFVCLSHTGIASGAWPLNDLPGAAGRVDVLCRNVQAALFLSHGLRADVEVYLAFHGPPARVVCIQGSAIQRLQPDERSTAARIQQALQAAWDVPDWKDVQPGLRVAAYTFAELLDELAPHGRLVLLDPEGAPVEGFAWPEDPVLLLSDHVPFAPQEYAELERRGVLRVSLGRQWYHGNHAIAVVQHALDRQAERSGAEAPVAVR
ncbi:MAG TPA: tRNA (pseudouridine(54)-N(1))-methyltransferase TrmY [Candidatus Thermoplasmatota archaeon]|nr:tRNA (pseudouridine(54)-N(1))-methyltransferase TrmY [Candidatus Thermoplasmatota archaeon]